MRRNKETLRDKKYVQFDVFCPRRKCFRPIHKSRSTFRYAILRKGQQNAGCGWYFGMSFSGLSWQMAANPELPTNPPISTSLHYVCICLPFVLVLVLISEKSVHEKKGKILQFVCYTVYESYTVYERRLGAYSES